MAVIGRDRDFRSEFTWNLLINHFLIKIMYFCEN